MILHRPLKPMLPHVRASIKQDNLDSVHPQACSTGTKCDHTLRQLQWSQISHGHKGLHANTQEMSALLITRAKQFTAMGGILIFNNDAATLIHNFTREQIIYFFFHKSEMHAKRKPLVGHNDSSGRGGAGVQVWFLERTPFIFVPIKIPCAI